MKNNRIRKFILDTENILSKSNEKNHFYKVIKKKIQEIRSIIKMTNIENFNIYSSQIVLKLICILAYTKMLSEILPGNKNDTITELNNYMGTFVRNATNDLGFKGLRYKYIRSFYTALYNIYSKLSNSFLKFKFDTQIYVAKCLQSIYLINIIDAIKYMFFTFINLNVYFLIYLILVLFILVSIFAKFTIYSLTCLF